MTHLASLPALMDIGVEPTTQLLELGTVDSIVIVALIAWLEQEFDIEIDPSLFEPERFATAEQIAALVAASV
jgi:acyl carrier protein